MQKTATAHKITAQIMIIISFFEIIGLLFPPDLYFTDLAIVTSFFGTQAFGLRSDYVNLFNSCYLCKNICITLIRCNCSGVETVRGVSHGKLIVVTVFSENHFAVFVPSEEFIGSGAVLFYVKSVIVKNCVAIEFFKSNFLAVDGFDFRILSGYHSGFNA